MFNPNILPPRLNRGNGTGDGSFRSEIWRGDPNDWIRDREGTTLEDTLHNVKPIPVPAGPMICSTSVSLEKWPTVVWDVNNYYAELGIHWSASNKEIREAYQALDGASSERLTYIVKQLLDPEIRRGYDATQLGSVFFDKYIAEYVKQQMMKDQVEETGRLMSFDEQIEAGYEAIDLSSFINKSVNPEEKDWTDDDPEFKDRWKWGYYLLGTEDYDTTKLQEWQSLLIQAFSEKSLVIGLGVGITIGQTGLDIVDSNLVAFISVNDNPEINLARKIAGHIDVGKTKQEERN